MASNQRSARGRAWKNERASVHKSGKARPRSNKYSRSDARDTPPAQRSRVWVGGYTRSDGTEVHGHYRRMNRPPRRM